MIDAFKLTAHHDKATGIVHLFRGKYQCLCPFRMPAVLPVPSSKESDLTLIGGKPKPQQFEPVHPFCNSACPHFKITPGYINEHGLLLNDTASVELKCTTTPGDKMPIL